MDLINTADFSILPTLEKYIANLQFLRTHNFDAYSAEDVSRVLRKKSIILPSHTATTEIESLGTNSFYRVRLVGNNDLIREDLHVIQTFSYPPSSFCRENGRANIKGTSVFYCASSANAAMRECNIEIGSEGYLSEWTIKSQTILRFSMLLSEELPADNPWKAATDYFSKDEFQRPYADKESLYVNHVKELRKFCNDLFMYETKPYPLSSYIANCLLYYRNDLDFIMYPCAKSSHKQINLAFHPNSVNQFMELKKIYRFVVESIEPEKISYHITGVGYRDGSRIYWNMDKSERITISNY